jgi:phospholipid-translocating ATPase
MIFRQCSIGGKVYKGDPEEVREEAPDVISTSLGVDTKADIRLSSADSSTAAGSNSERPSEAKDKDPTAVPNPLEAEGVKLSKQVLYHFSDAQLKEDLESSIHADPDSENAAHARSLNGFFTVLALCHTVLTGVDPETGAIEYKAQSPDEAALVQAAADVGFVFRGRDSEILMLQTPFADEVERYELLNILEFTSARKRMSVVLRKLDGQDGRLFLLSKGADNVIFERLKSGGEEMKNITEKQLGEFASEGLRTLTLAYKVINGTSSLLAPEYSNLTSGCISQRTSMLLGVNDTTRPQLPWKTGTLRSKLFRTSWSKT